MNFKEWQNDNGYIDFKEIERAAWIAAMNSCAEMLEKEAAELVVIANACVDLESRLDAITKRATIISMVILIRTEIANS